MQSINNVFSLEDYKEKKRQGKMPLVPKSAISEVEMKMTVTEALLTLFALKQEFIDGLKERLKSIKIIVEEYQEFEISGEKNEKLDDVIRRWHQEVGDFLLARAKWRMKILNIQLQLQNIEGSEKLKKRIAAHYDALYFNDLHQIRIYPEVEELQYFQEFVRCNQRV